MIIFDKHSRWVSGGTDLFVSFQCFRNCGHDASWCVGYSHFYPQTIPHSLGNRKPKAKPQGMMHYILINEKGLKQLFFFLFIDFRTFIENMNLIGVVGQSMFDPDRAIFRGKFGGIVENSFDNFSE